MNPTFNLLWEPWLPCSRPDGGIVHLGLVAALEQAHELRAVAGDTPLETAAIHRLLLAFLHRVFDSSSKQAWADLWCAGRWDSELLEAYAHQWEHRFDLFDPKRPFYQTQEDRVEAKSIAGLKPGLKSDLLYNHDMDTGALTLMPDRAARVLITVQTFGLPGICHPQKNLFFKGAPGLGGWFFLVEGANLFQTLCLNLLPYGKGTPRPTLDRSSDDAPAWEMDEPYLPSRTYPLGYLDYLTWQNRRVQLLPECGPAGCLVRQARETPGLCIDSELLDPLRHYRKDEKRGFLPTSLRPDRALWRDSSSLLSIHLDTKMPPEALRHLASMALQGVLPRTARLRLMAVGLANDKAKAEMYRLERVPLRLAYLERPDLVMMLERSIGNADQARNKVWAAVRQLAAFVLALEADQQGGREPHREDIRKLMDHWAWERGYWSALELAFWALLDGATDGDADAAMLQWNRALCQAARDTLEAAIRLAGDGIPALKGAVKARSVLNGGLAKLQLLPESGQAEPKPETDPASVKTTP